MSDFQRRHRLPIGALVEDDDGVRLFVAKHTRDCDGTALYTLTTDKLEFMHEFSVLARGYPERYLKLIKEK